MLGIRDTAMSKDTKYCPQIVLFFETNRNSSKITNESLENTNVLLVSMLGNW